MSDLAGLSGPVRIIGAGLIGTSIGLALRRAGYPVQIGDADAAAAVMASQVGAGDPVSTQDPALVVVAVPPDVVAAVVVEQLRATASSGAIVTDVASIKGLPLRQVAAQVTPAELERYLGSHPMAGSERSGPLAARADMFDGATWAITAHQATTPQAQAAVAALATACGADVVQLDVAGHDAAVAAVSHVPHLASSLVASLLQDAPDDYLSLAGQGVRDVTRIAGGDPQLWTQIARGNSAAVSQLLIDMRNRLDAVIDAVCGPDGAALTNQLADGVRGRARIPGKHGMPPAPWAIVTAVLSDEPGQLARLFADLSSARINIEDMSISHSPGRLVGYAELTVRPDAVAAAVDTLAAHGWQAYAGRPGTE